MVQCFLVESDSLLLKNGSFLFLLFFLSASQMIYTKLSLDLRSYQNILLILMLSDRLSERLHEID